MLEKYLKKSTWTDIIISALFALLGVALIAKPDVMITVLSTVLALIFIFIGGLTLIDYFRNEVKSSYLLLASIVAIVIGVVMLNYPGFIASVFRIIIAIWILYKGLINLQTTLVWKEYSSKMWIFAVVLAIVTLGLGVYVLFCEGALLTTLGVLILIYAITDIVDSVIFMKNINDFKKEITK